jgi:hypothetical protein
VHQRRWLLLYKARRDYHADNRMSQCKMVIGLIMVPRLELRRRLIQVVSYDCEVDQTAARDSDGNGARRSTGGAGGGYRAVP